MGWDHGGRYYTRSRREGGRIVREYIGGGRAGEIVAQLDELARERCETERQMRRIEREEIDELDAGVNELDEHADLLARAALVAAGFRQHKRGEWRKKRG